MSTAPKHIGASKMFWIGLSALIYGAAELVQHYTGSAELAADAVSKTWVIAGVGLVVVILRVFTRSPVRLPDFITRMLPGNGGE